MAHIYNARTIDDSYLTSKSRSESGNLRTMPGFTSVSLRVPDEGEEGEEDKKTPPSSSTTPVVTMVTGQHLHPPPSTNSNTTKRKETQKHKAKGSGEEDETHMYDVIGLDAEAADQVIPEIGLNPDSRTDLRLVTGGGNTGSSTTTTSSSSSTSCRVAAVPTSQPVETIPEGEATTSHGYKNVGPQATTTTGEGNEGEVGYTSIPVLTEVATTVPKPMASSTSTNSSSSSSSKIHRYEILEQKKPEGQQKQQQKQQIKQQKQGEQHMYHTLDQSEEGRDHKSAAKLTGAVEKEGGASSGKPGRQTVTKKTENLEMRDLDGKKSRDSQEKSSDPKSNKPDSRFTRRSTYSTASTTIDALFDDPTYITTGQTTNLKVQGSQLSSSSKQKPVSTTTAPPPHPRTRSMMMTQSGEGGEHLQGPQQAGRQRQTGSLRKSSSSRGGGGGGGGQERGCVTSQKPFNTRDNVITPLSHAPVKSKDLRPKDPPMFDEPQYNIPSLGPTTSSVPAPSAVAVAAKSGGSSMNNDQELFDDPTYATGLSMKL